MAGLDLENFHHQRPWFFGMLAALLVVSVVKDMIRDGHLPGGTNLAFHGAFLAGAMLGIRMTSERGHRILAYASLLLFTVYIGALFFEL